MKSLFFFLLTLSSICLHSQVLPYEVKRDSVGFYMLSNGNQTRFDTAQVVQTLEKKQEETLSIENEIQLLERLVVLRRQLAATRNDENTLREILEKARKCNIEK